MNLKPKTYNPKPCSGQSLVEIIIGLGIGSILIGASTVAIMGILRSSTASQNSQAASSFNQETLHRVRVFANANWQNLTALSKGTSTSYFLNASGSVFFATQGKDGVIDNDVLSGLVAKWGFDEATSTTNTTTTDVSGNAYHGTLVNGTGRASSTCKISYCLDFDGNDDFVSSSPSINPSATNFSALAWVKLDNASGTNQIIIGQTGTNGRAWLQRTVSSGTLCSALGGSTTCSLGTFAAGSWIHAVITYDGTTVKLYLNGAADGSAAVTAESETGGLRIGAHKSPDTTNEEWDGLIDDVRVYNRALSANEIKQVYESRIFSRSFSIENVCRTNSSSSTISGTAPCTGGDVNDPLTQKITTFTEWTPVGGTASQLTIVDYVTRTRNAVFLQTDWSGGSGQEGPLTEPNSRFASGTNVSTSTPGFFRIQGL